MFVAARWYVPIVLDFLPMINQVIDPGCLPPNSKKEWQVS